MDNISLGHTDIITENVSDNQTQLLQTISELSASNVKHLEDIRQLQYQLDKMSRQVFGLQYKLVEAVNSKELHQNSISSLVINTSNMFNANNVRDCIIALKDSIVRQFNISSVDILFRTLGGVYENTMQISEFLNSRELAQNFINLEEHVDACQKQNNLSLTQCNSEQVYFLGCTRKYAYSSIAVHETQPVFAIVFERETPLELFEMQLLDNLLRAYATVISFKRRLMQSTILSSTFASKYQHAVEKSLTDTLTHVYNREALEENIERNYKHTQYLIIFYDLDNFKYVNDTFGHPAGDQVLAWFGHTVKEFSTELGGDTYRFGGDEFISIFTGGEDLINLVENNLENLMRKIRQKEFVFPKAIDIVQENETNTDESIEETMYRHKITTSIGIYYNKDNLSFNDAKKRADAGLYRSKDAGRNTITTIS